MIIDIGGLACAFLDTGFLVGLELYDWLDGVMATGCNSPRSNDEGLHPSDCCCYFCCIYDWELEDGHPVWYLFRSGANHERRERLRASC